MFEINNSQQKSDRGMKISTFPAVKPFIKLTRGRIGVEEGRREKTFGEGAERAGGKQEGSRCNVRRREERREAGKVTLGTGKGKEAKFVCQEEESHLEHSRADRGGGAVSL